MDKLSKLDEQAPGDINHSSVFTERQQIIDCFLSTNQSPQQDHHNLGTGNSARLYYETTSMMTLLNC